MANYTYLVEDLIAATENDGTEFLNYIPKIVGRAEERLTRVLDDYGNVRGSNIKFVGTTNTDAGDIMIPDFGIRVVGPVKVSAPTPTATVAIYYG